MSTRAGAVAVILALGLIVLALVLMRPGAPAPGSASQPSAQSTPPIDADSIESFTVTWKGQASTLSRDERGGWSVRMPTGSWPVDPQRVDALLRIIGSLTLDAETAKQTAPSPENLITIALTLRGDPATTMAFTDAPVAGKVMAMRDGKPFAMADARIVDLTARNGPMTWRSLLVIPDRDARGAARIAISTDGADSIELARLDGVWRMRRPMSARADAEAVGALLDRLSAVKVIEFADADAPGSSLEMGGKSTARRGIELAWDQRSAESDGALTTRTIIRKIAFGDAPAGQSDRVRATVDGPSRQAMLISADVPVGISTAARNYLAATATGVAPADVGFLRIRGTEVPERGFRREGTGWTTMPSGAPTDAAPIEALLRFLSETEGEPQESFRETDIRGLVRIELMDFEAEPVEFLDAGYTADGVLAVRAGSVVWLYGRQSPPDLLGLPAFESLAPLPTSTRTTPPPPSETK